ncbi:DUF3343 domain-containing protein [Calderihabitans maritimus]|uniref:Putative Se/S carrier protein-like domain-containing protein n=1 Tax=Calderihabitans maritimus TaxID=1246530 RepID=A0A1Z5HVX5_9FIRM|nr:DUF3343 domain-containing protein [Calderihabitans maritimus]GAW93682.1 hypothetical protein TherJR_1345 [Calderihabitans maritimus]
MDRNLLNLKEFWVITFSSTHDALHADKVLRQQNLPYLLIPTPREISRGCGISVKLSGADLKQVLRILEDHKVQFREVHCIKRN